jgi:hypothetical protein
VIEARLRCDNRYQNSLMIIPSLILLLNLKKVEIWRQTIFLGHPILRRAVGRCAVRWRPREEGAHEREHASNGEIHGNKVKIPVCYDITWGRLILATA